MNPLIPCLPTLAVSAIYCLWHAYQQDLLRRREKLRRPDVLRERVTYMLWVMANRID